MTSPDLLLGIDAGTSVVKVALYDGQGVELGVVRRRTELRSPQPLWSETDMEATWWAVAGCVRALLDQHSVDPGRVAAVGLSGTMVGAWLVDVDGKPVRPGILWNDGRTQPLIEAMLAEDPGFMQRVTRTSGSVMQQGCTLPLLRWLRDHEPDSLRRAAHVSCCKDFIGFRLTGVAALDPSEASVLPGDAGARGYSEALVDLFGLRPFRTLLPPLRPSEALLGSVTPEAAAATGLRQGTPVGVGAGDVIASNLGLGALAPGTATTLLGTNILIGIVTGAPLLEPLDVGLLFTMPAHRWLRAMVTVSGTTSLDWFIDRFCSEERGAATSPADLYARLEALARESAPGSNGVLYLPYLSDLGITAPYYEPAARAQFFGLSDRHTRADLLHAIYEGVALSIGDGIAALPLPARSVLLSGGGARSAFWSQLIADVCGVPVVVPQGTAEFGAKGAALLVAVAISRYADVDTAVAAQRGDSTIFTPSPELTDLYRRRAVLYGAVRDDLRRAWQLAAQPA